MVNFIPKKLNSIGIIGISQVNIHRITLHPKGAAAKIGCGARVEVVDQRMQQGVASDFIAYRQPNHLVGIVFRIAHAINTAHRRHYEHVSPAAHQRRGGAQPQFFDFLVDGEVFFDVGVGSRNEGLGLVIVVIAHKIFHRVIWKKLLELAIQLRHEGFVVGKHQSGFLHLLQHIGHGKGLARARHPQ